MNEVARQRFAVVTGASSGIGAATSRLLAQQGWKVILIARNQAALDRVLTEIPHGNPIAIALDASDGKLVALAAEKIISEHGVPDVVINSAGAGTWRFLEESSPDDLQQMVNAPFMAAMYITRAFMMPMLQRKRGLFVHINSPVSSVGWPGATGYMASRWALRGLHESLRLDLYGTGVKSSHILFGKVKSSYFINNPGSEERLPAVARIIPELIPEQCAKVIYQTIERPKNQVIYPHLLKAFYAMNWLMPWAVRRLAILTGRKHSLKEMS